MPRIYLRNGRRPRSPANPTQAPGRPVAQRPSRASLGNARQRACVRWLRSTPRKEQRSVCGIAARGLMSIQFHADCFVIWESERLEPFLQVVGGRHL